MSVGLKNVCRTTALPGASRNRATSAPSTTMVLAVDTATAPRPLPSSRDPRRAWPKDVWGGPTIRTRPSGLDRRHALVDLQVLLLQGGQRAVAIQRGQRRQHSARQRIPRSEEHTSE